MQKRNDFIVKLLEKASIQNGMRVLDVGCATGEVTQIVANKVGDQGEVIGVDMNQDMLHMAEENNQFENVKYIKGDIYNLPKDISKFDAIVGRSVLMYLPGAYKALNVLKGHLKPNGIFCFQESDAINGGVGADNLPMHQKAIQLVWKTVESEGGDIHIGQKLYTLFQKVGVVPVEFIAEAVIQTSDDNDLKWLIDIMATRMKERQVVKPSFSIEQFLNDLTNESEKHHSAFIRDMAFGICGRI
ncbi:class I SAM-dependent methyltransferase [Staphylococcus saprophyticus]|uniref:class I SAM-dependent methyltransferase n=1 Tax=Staphylococcus saprophyticus TaxID=29385 RepID=UPI0022EB183D|nr:methyltransferase domain-containing protein [Staphylococcus saprophyticus]